MSQGLSSVLIRGVGRRILGLFCMAAVLPVLFTAFLAYNEIGRGLEQVVNTDLRESSKTYGVRILTQLNAASEKAAEVVRIVEEGGVAAIRDRQYLLREFASVLVLSPNHPFASIHGEQAATIIASAIDFDHLATGKSQLLENRGSGEPDLILLRRTHSTILR